MDRINKILFHNKYRTCINKIEAAEADRCFCCHDIRHFLDVARLAMIYNMQEELKIEKDYIYAAALLHDIGRFKEYESGIPHNEASAQLALPILKDAGFSKEEINIIVDAILMHRKDMPEQKYTLSDLIYIADKKSRNCFMCKADKECNWSETKKNRYLDF